MASSSSSSYSLPSFFSANGRPSPLFLPNKSPKTLTLIKAHSFEDEGRSTRKNMVDENLNVLKERMEMVKVKERLERCCTNSEIGWNYNSQLSIQQQRRHRCAILNKTLTDDLIQTFGLVCGTVGSTCLSGTFILCIISLIVHFHSLLSFN